MTTTDPVVWLNGTLLPQSQARLDPMARGFLHGMGVYDALLLRRGVPVALEKHVARLTEGASRLGLTAPGVEELTRAISQVSRECGLPDARIRITVAAGPSPETVPPSDAPQVCLVTASRITGAKPSATVVTSPWRRNEHSPLAGIKFTSCAESVLAQRAALAAGADEAIFLNTALALCEGAFSNVFIVRLGSVITPPISSGCLPGVTRDVVIDLCRRNGIPSREETILDAPGDADEVFLTSSIRGIQPVSSFDGRHFQAPGRITQELMSAYAAWLETFNRHAAVREQQKSRRFPGGFR